MSPTVCFGSETLGDEVRKPDTSLLAGPSRPDRGQELGLGLTQRRKSQPLEAG